MTCSPSPRPLALTTTTTTLCHDRANSNIGLWSHHQNQQREIAPDLKAVHGIDSSLWMACSPKARPTCDRIPSSSLFDNLPLDVDKKMFRSSRRASSSTSTSRRSTRCNQIDGIHQAHPPRSINVEVLRTSMLNPDGGSGCDHSRMPEATRQMLEYLWTDEEDKDQSSLGEPYGTTNHIIVSDQSFHSMVDALCGPSD